MTVGELVRLLGEWPDDLEVRIKLHVEDGGICVAPVLGTSYEDRLFGGPVCFISNEGLR